MIGAPDADGTRQPFMAGYYKCRADLKETIDAYAGTITKIGTGTASLVVTGTFNNTEDLSFVVQAETTGEIGTATIKWSLDGGNSWEKSGIVSMTSILPLKLKNGVSIYFTPAAGTDLVAGDKFSFTAYARRNTFVVAGAPFQEISNVYLNGVEIYDTSPNLTTGELTVIGSSGFVDVRVVKSDITNPIGIIEEILAEVGLTSYIDLTSFSNAYRDLMDIEIGVRFEAVAAWKAIQSICTTCLDLLLDRCQYDLCLGLCGRFVMTQYTFPGDFEELPAALDHDGLVDYSDLTGSPPDTVPDSADTVENPDDSSRLESISESLKIIAGTIDATEKVFLGTAPMGLQNAGSQSASQSVPGGVLALLNTTSTTTISVAGRLMWAEVPV